MIYFFIIFLALFVIVDPIMYIYTRIQNEAFKKAGLHRYIPFIWLYYKIKYKNNEKD